MDIITKPAEWVHRTIYTMAEVCSRARQNGRHCKGAAAYTTVGVVNVKAAMFNICTAGLITCVALGVLLKGLPSTSALLLGGCFFFGRRVTDKSFNVTSPNLITQFLPNIMKPTPRLSFDGIVIFYNTTLFVDSR